jgi:predicted dehydrogenase
MKETKRIAVAIVGCGAAAQELHSPSLLELEKRNMLSVRALYDPNGRELEAIGRLFPNASRCASIDELARQGCDVALVASPARFHADQTIQCLNAGLSVFCEKPMAVSSADAEAMIRSAREKGKLLAIGQVRRFFPAAQIIKQLMEQQHLGALKSFRAREGGNFRWPAKSASFFDRRTSGGGVLIDNGVHALDLLLWWLGEPSSFTYEDDAMGGVEINCRVNMNYPAFSGSLQVSWDYEIPNGYYFEFERGWLFWHPYVLDQIELGYKGVDQRMHAALEAGQLQRYPVPHQSKASASYHHFFLPQWLNFIGALDGRESLRVPGEEGIKCLAFVEKCYASRSFMEPPWFSDEEKTGARKASSSVHL